MSALPHVAIVILNYNGEAHLKQNLPFLNNQTYSNSSIFVIDNQSTDGSVNWLQQNHPSIKIIRNPENMGFAKGYNNGLQQIKSDYYLLLNTDVEVTPYFLQPMVNLLQNHPKGAVCQPKILSQQKREYFEYAGAGGGMMDRLGYPFARGRLFFLCEKDNHQYDNEIEIFWASGACFLIKATSFWEAGGFYEYYFMQHEETDLCWRLKRAGYKVFYTGKAWVYHEGGAHLSYTSPQKNLLNFRNNWVMLYRNLPPLTFWCYIVPIRTALDVLASFYFLFRNNFKTFLSVYIGLIQFWKWWWHQEKKTAYTGPSFTSLTGVYKHWIVIDYFIKKKKRFSDL